jgi:hypothetical protein
MEVCWERFPVWENEDMPTLVIDNMPQSLFERIEQLAQDRRQNAAEAVVEILEAALPKSIPATAERLPQELFLSDEISAPCSIPRPVGQHIVPVEVVDYTPSPHDVPAAD